jgi:glutaredoxin 2
MESSNLSLYHYEGCPYCTMVRDASSRLGLDLELRDILRDEERLKELMAGTGRRMVPCLRIEEAPGQVRWMHESADIIRYLQEQA